MWEKKGSVDQTFTWKTFFAALSSDNIKEKKAMENILNMLTESPSEDDQGDDQELILDDNTSIQDLQTIIRPLNKSGKDELAPKLKGLTMADCLCVNFHAILNPCTWKVLEPFKLFTMSVSRSTGRKYLIGPLHDIQYGEEEHIYEATLPIPSDFCSDNYFKYKYVVLQLERKKLRNKLKLKKNGMLEEDLCINGHEWRVIYLTDVHQKQKKVVKHFDPVILPPGSAGMLQAVRHYFSNKDPLTESSQTALCSYLLYGFNKLGWLAVDKLMSSDEIVEKGYLISIPFLSLKSQFRYATKHKQPVPLNDYHLLEKTFLSELSKAIGLLSCMEKLHCALIISNVMKHSGLISTPTLFKEDVVATKEIVNGFQLPVNHLDSCAVSIKNFRNHGHFEDCVSFFENMSSEIRDTVFVPTLTTLCQVLVDDKDVHWEWMGALPLLHVLKGSTINSKAEFPVLKEKIYELLFGGIQISHLQSKIVKLEERFAKDSFHYLHPFFDVDWLLPRAWICMIPLQAMHCIRDLPSVTPFACWHVGIKLSTIPISVIEDFNAVLLLFLTYTIAFEFDCKDNTIFYKGAKSIMKFCEKEKADCFLTSLQLFLQVLKKINWKNEEYIHSCTTSIRTWVRTSYGDAMISSKVDAELEDWSCILKIIQDVNIFQDVLNGGILSTLNSRLNQLKTQRKVEIILDDKAKDQRIKNAVIQSFHNSAPNTDNDVSQLLSYLNKSGFTSDTLVVLGGILRSTFKKEAEVNLKTIFWKFLPDCLEIYGNCLQEGYTLNTDHYYAAKLCETAKDVLQHLFSRLESRTITLKELDQIMECDSSTLEEVLSSFIKLQFFQEHAKFNAISIESIQKELRAYKCLKEKKSKVLHFVHKILEFAEEESQKIKDLLSADQSSCSVCDVWTFDEHAETPKYCFSELRCAPDNIIDEIYYFTSSEGCCSQIFGSHWTNSKKKYVQSLNGKHITISTFVNDLWIPVINEFQSDLESLSDGLQLPLEKVTELFDGIRERKVLEHELEKWCIAFKHEKRAWIRNAAQKILEYQELTYYSKSAHTLMELKNTLKLSGDFNILTNLLQTEKESSTTEEMTLASVDTTSKETAGVLKDIAEHPLRRKCLEVFCSCTELAEWIRKMAKNVGQLAEVVQISNQTMEGDMVKQLLSDLLVFGSAYAPLIYEIRPNESCESLVNRCKSLWTFLDKHPDLHSIAKLCNERLGEFKRIEEALTDFQKSNVEQMNTINMKGIYAVSAIPGKIHHSTEGAVRLRLRDLGNEKERKVYSLSDLKELQSRLVLVAAENADNVNRFIEILLKVECVAELLIKLQESGYIDYTHYTLQFGCSQYKKKDIDEHISKLDKTLIDWKKSVQSHRKKYPQLNYYTSQQLLDLQKEFGKLKKDPSLRPSCKLMLLLLSVTSNPSESRISRVISLIASMSQGCSDRAAKSIISHRPIATLGLEERRLNVGVLSEKEKELYDTLTSDDHYSPALVLRAFEASPKDADEDDLRFWCMDNESKFSEDEQSEVFVPDSVGTNQHDGIEVTADDPLVKELLDEDYDLNIAIEAVKISKTTSIDMREAVLSLDLGKSPQAKRKTGWTIPSKFTQVPFSVKVDVPRDEYLTLVELGCVLQELACTIGEVGGLMKERSLRRHVIEKGTQNVIVTDEVWKTVLYLYMSDESLPLPTNEEIVVCTETTSVEEVTLLWHRAVNDENKYRLFTLVNGEKLPYKICEEVLNNLEFITQGSSDFRIAIVVNSTDQSRGYICSRLGSYVRNVPALPPDDEVTKYIISHTQSQFATKSEGIGLSTDEKNILKSLQGTVQTVVSTLPGMGKSLRIKRYAEILKREYMTKTDEQEKLHYVCVPIHGPEISLMMLIERLEECKQDPNNAYPQIIHFNIANSILEKIDWLLFQILILGTLADRYGNVWKKVHTQICIIECTLSKLEDAKPGQWTLNDPNMKHLPTTYSLLSLLPQTLCVSPKTVEISCQSSGEPGELVLFDESVFKEDSVQRVFQYLKRFANSVSMDSFSYSKQEGNTEECLSTILKAMSSNSMKDEFDPSWSQIRNFITFLNEQLSDCEQSVFCCLGDIKGFKQFIVRFAIVMAKEFTEPSMNIGKGFKDVSVSNLEELYSVVDGKSWNECAHPYLFFNQDEGYSMTFMGLWIDKEGNLIHYRNGQKETAENNYMNQNLRNILAENGVQFMEEYDQLGKKEMLQKLIRMLGINEREFITDGKLDWKKIDPDESYVLTLDNLMKMLAIHMKFRCGIPVIMMGETGCGKTRLLRYLCEIQDNVFKTKTLSCLKVHGGTNEERIVQEVEKAKALAEQNQSTHGKHVYSVLFFDEVNTTEALDLIKEIICDRTLNGKPIPKGIKFAAACNPYRVHDEETLKSLQSAGLGFYLQDEERIPKLGNIPLRKLVYRVLPLPSSMNQYVYDFGTVSGKSERKYIERIVINQIADCRHIGEYESSGCQKLLVTVLEECQSYMRDQKNECRYVSLRDVVRAMVLFNFFLEKLRTVDMFKELLKSQMTDDSEECQLARVLCDITRALIFSISVCYYARLSDKSEENSSEDVNGGSGSEENLKKINRKKVFIKRIVSKFGDDYIKLDSLESKIKFFEDEILRVQTIFLNAMNVPSNIAHNAALRENVFMMAVCIENRLPLFIVGKPGSSKSLAKSIVANSMQGQYSTNKFLTYFKQIQLFPYQCNQFSTTETLVEVFEEAKAFQKRQKDYRNFASVVVLEEIGLAEDTPGLPLKVLHPYLEDGTAGINPDDQDVKPEERVAFIGISNWALDPAKMNRGIMVTRSSPPQEELLKSAYGIAKMIKDDLIRDELSKSFDGLAEMYRRICRLQEAETDNGTGNDEAREFFGLRDFYTMIKMLCWKCIDTGKCPQPEDFRYVILRNFSGHSLIDPLEQVPNASSLISRVKMEHEEFNIIQTSLEPLRMKPESKGSKRDNRYLLFITENQTALGILRTHLLKDETPYIFYGSSFPKDKDYTQVCVNINKIKVCMERGIPVILLNYGQIYESLYDVLNQCYTELHTGRYVDLGLRSYKIKCRVHPNFRLIIIAEESRVFTQFPTALINRMEKHLLVSKTILTSTQHQLLVMIENWAKCFSSIKTHDYSFTTGDAFVGYQEDTAATILLYAMHQLPENTDETEIEKYCRKMHLQLASSDALARLCSPPSNLDDSKVKEAFNVYFEEQEHFCLSDCLQKYLQADEDCETGKLMQITTFGPLLVSNHKFQCGIDDIHIYHTSEFETEIDFCGMLSEHFKTDKNNPRLLIIQCEWERWNTDLIACARHRVQDERIKASSRGITHVLFVIRLARVTGGTPFTSFQGYPWICVHIDDLTNPRGINIILKTAFTKPITAFVQFLIENEAEVPPTFKVCNRIKENIQISLAKTVSYSTYKKIENLIEVLLNLIDDSGDSRDNPSFTTRLQLRIQNLSQQRDEELITPPDKWAIDAALERSKLQTNLTLVNSIKRYFDTQLQKILSYIIVQLDINQNINLFASSTNKYLRELWLSLFSKDNFFQLNYQDTFVSSSSSFRNNNFQSKFPFSWEVIDQINAVFNKLIIHNEGISTAHIFKDLVSALELQAFAESINGIPFESSGEFYECYLSDYLLNLQLPFEDSTSANKILHKAVVSVSCSLEPAIAQNLPYPLLNGIASIHLAYHSMEKEVFYFTELCARYPDLPSQLQDAEILSSGKVIFHVLGMSKIIEKTSPDGKDWNAETVKEWLHGYHGIRNVVETIMNLQDEYDEQTQLLIDSCRSEWQKTQAVVLLAEHVVVNLTYTDLYVFLKRYYNILKKHKFTQPEILTITLRQIQAILRKLPVKQQPKCELCQENLKLKNVIYLPCGNNHILCESCFNDSLKKRGPRCPCCNEPIPRNEKFEIPEVKKKEYEMLRSAQQNCMDFFMEMVSQCCFSSLLKAESPTDDFLEQLLKIITDTENEDYRELFPLDEEYSHSCPIARSVLLQELLERNPTEVKKKLQEYQKFIKAEGYISDDQQLALLCIKSIEDGLHKQCHLKSSLDERIDFVKECLSMAFEQTLSHGDLVKDYRVSIPIQYMECIAQVRFGLCFASTMFYRYYCNQGALQNLPSSTKNKLEQLRVGVRTLIRDGVITEPRDFLIKQLVRQYGFTYLDVLAKHEGFQEWITEKNEGEKQSHDEFVVCGSSYLKLRSKWGYADISAESSKEELQEKPIENNVTVCLALFRRLLTRSSECVPPLVFTDLRREIASLVGFSENFLEAILGGECDLPSLRNIFSPWEIQTTTKLSTIVVHFAAVIAVQSDKNCGIFNPFINILKDSTDLKDCFWPAMPDSILDIVMGLRDDRGSYGSWWRCENGHFYFIGDCGNPINSGDEPGKIIKYNRCHECGVPIGGRHLRDDRKLQVTERSGQTEPGHCLDPSTRRSSIPMSQRELSPVSNCIVIILVHASCIWAASSKNFKNLVQSINLSSEIMDEEVLTFFWNHFEKDFETLSRATQHSFDDCILVVHSVIHNMFEVKVDMPDVDSLLKSRDQRHAWEKAFDETFIKPVTTDFELTVQAAREQVINDCNKDHKKLYQMIYEKANYDQTTKIDPHLWIYRPIITIDHVAKSLQQLKDSVKADLTILQEFLKNVDHLVALQYLPDIVQMQSTLYQICNHRIDQHEAQSMSIESFIKDYIPKAHQREKLLKEVKSFCTAWNRVKEQLPKQMMVPLDHKYASVEMTPSQQLSYFIPLNEGSGVCSVALANYLAKLQNDFIEVSWKKLARSEQSKFKVPIQRIQRSQIINFEQQLTNVIFSHCKYSLKAGHGADVTYDFVALEKHILDRFVRGKPLINTFFPGMSYRSDVIEALKFRKIRRTIKQEQLPQRDKEDILVDVRRNQCFQECIDAVNVTLGFIQYGNWQPHFMLKRCFATLKLDRKLPNIIEDRCQVKHLISLWRVLNVEQARQLTHGKEDPFSDVKPAFKEELDDDLKELLKTELGPYDIDQFLDIFYEFITTHVKNRSENEADEMLVDSYIDVCDFFELEKIKDFEDRFPPEFSLKHVVSIWKYAIHYQEQQRQY